MQRVGFMGDIRVFESLNSATSFLKKTRSLSNFVVAQTSLIFLVHYREREKGLQKFSSISSLWRMQTHAFKNRTLKAMRGTCHLYGRGSLYAQRYCAMTPYNRMK